MRQKFAELKTEAHRFKIIKRYFNIPLLLTDRTSIQEITKVIENSYNIINKFNLTNIQDITPNNGIKHNFFKYT